jgi:hypothetical protein
MMNVLEFRRNNKRIELRINNEWYPQKANMLTTFLIHYLKNGDQLCFYPNEEITISRNGISSPYDGPLKILNKMLQKMTSSYWRKDETGLY